MGKMHKKAQVKETSSKIFPVFIFLCVYSKYSATSLDFKTLSESKYLVYMYKSNIVSLD